MVVYLPPPLRGAMSSIVRKPASDEALPCFRTTFSGKMTKINGHFTTPKILFLELFRTNTVAI